jgi:hypothetical protein
MLALQTTNILNEGVTAPGSERPAGRVPTGCPPGASVNVIPSTVTVVLTVGTGIAVVKPDLATY